MGSATTGWFGAGSSPTVNTKCDVSLSKNGTTVTVNWTVHMKLASEYSYLDSGSLEVYCACSGAEDGKTIKDHYDYWEGTDEHTASGSFTFNSGSTAAQTFNINFNSDSDYFSSSGIFDVDVSCSVEASVTTPTVTCTITGRTVNTISASMTVTNDGGASIVDRYINLYSNSACTTKVGTITGASGTFTGLNPNTTYYAKANASNGTYRGYSSVQSNTTYQKGTITSASNFNHGDNSSLVVANPSGASLTLAMKIGTTQIFSKSVSAGTITNTFTDTQLDNIYKLYGNGSSLTVTYILTTTANGTSYTDSRTCTVTLTGNQKTAYVGSGGKKRAKVYVGVNGSVKRAVVWVGNNNTRKRCI